MSGELGRFVLENVPGRCDLKSALIEFAALGRGLDVDRVNTSTVLVHLPTGVAPFVGMNGPDSSYVAKWLSNHKTGQLALAARCGLPVAEWAVFPANWVGRGLRYARGLGWPVAVQPDVPSRAYGVAVGIRDERQFRAAWRRAVGSYRAEAPMTIRHILVEEDIAGEHFQFFVVGGRVVAATQQVPASVVGNGTSTISELIERKNTVRSTNPCLRAHSIPDDADDLDALTSAGRHLTEVPGEGERVVLSTRSDVRAGGDSVDLTDEVDGYFQDLVVRAVRAIPGLTYGGVDVIAPTVTSAPGEGHRHVVSDIAFSPVPLASFPTHGPPRDIGGAIIEHHLANPRWDMARRRSHASATA